MYVLKWIMQIKGEIVWNKNNLSNRDMCLTHGQKIELWDGFLNAIPVNLSEGCL